MPSELSPAFLADDRRTPAMVGIVVVTALSFIVVVIRLYARKCLVRELGWDDYFIVMAQLTSWATMSLCLMILRNGAGKHLPSLSPDSLVRMYKWLVTTQMVYMFNLWLCRVSGLAFYARLNPMPQFILYLRLSLAFVTLVWVIQALIIGLQCVPLAALWGEVEGWCMGSGATFVSTGALTIVCDSLVLLLPVKIVLSLQATVARKVALLGVLCFGVFAIVTSILRMVSMIVSVQNAKDATWFFSPVIAWTCAEVSAAIIALSLPALRAIFGFLKEQRSARDASASYPTSNSNSNGTGIGLDDVSRSRERERKVRSKVRARSRVYDYEDSVDGDVECSRSTSQEGLFDARDRRIRVTETVDVDVQ
ncbi:hypothetical protein BDV19DRAFT_361281 [Aspergillus venezuelensis]